MVQPFLGNWALLQPPDDLAELINVGPNSFNDGGYKSRCVLAAAQAGEDFFRDGGNASCHALTLLGQVEAILPHHGEEARPNAHWTALNESLRLIGFRLMQNSCDIVRVGSVRTDMVIQGELGLPAAAFGCTTLSGRPRYKQEVYPHGIGYVTLARTEVRIDTLQINSFKVGWGDPADGRRCEVPVDVAAVRKSWPDLQPVLKPSTYAGGL